MSRKLRPFYIGALAIIGVGLMGTAFLPKAHADAWDKMTIVTVNEPVIAGNKVLDPGTYVWKLLNSPSNRHIVQIYDKDQRHCPGSHYQEVVFARSNRRVCNSYSLDIRSHKVSLQQNRPNCLKAHFLPFGIKMAGQ